MKLCPERLQQVVESTSCVPRTKRKEKVMNIDKLLKSKRMEVKITETKVDRHFVKTFRENNHLTQVALANILGVTKKTIEKWEQGINNVGGSSAVLLRLLNDNPTLLEQIYSVKFNEKEKNK